MVKFIGIKVHYDHRPLMPYLKYSKPASDAEYKEYLKLHKKGVGGEGFHECMNFMLRDDERVKLYLPPTALPVSDGKLEDEFVIFWFTYKADEELSAHIIGVHGGVRFERADREGVIRNDIKHLAAQSKWFFHATAEECLTTLILPPVPFRLKDRRHTPALEKWGNGLRYLEKRHAENIVSDALEGARQKLAQRPSRSEYEVTKREIDVLDRLVERYSLSAVAKASGTNKASKGHVFPLPDKELGELGERVVFERELSYAKSIGVGLDSVEWTSKSAPASPFDIKTVRKTKNGLKEHFIEVKSSRANGLGDSVYISSGQVEFFEDAGESGNFTFVRFDSDLKVKAIDELSLAEVREKFILTPIKYRLVAKMS